MLLHRFKQSSNEGITAEDRSSLAPPKSLSHNIRYETVPRVGSTTVLFPCGQADITVGLVDDALVVFELAGGLCDAEVELAVGVAPGAVVVIITVTTATGGDDDSGPSEAVLGPARRQIFGVARRIQRTYQPPCYSGLYSAQPRGQPALPQR